MKLAAIYNLFDGEELLMGSIKSIDADIIIVVFQRTSNYGEERNPFDYMDYLPDEWYIYEFIPKVWNGRLNEIEKRNIGLEVAREYDCTHFIHMDCDEYYKDFKEAKKLYLESGAGGSVCRLWTYFKEPTLRLTKREEYFVPFIHELREDTKAGFHTYPFYVDPTRRINEFNVIELPIDMHHYSWVRADIERKCRNSSARSNHKNQILIDYHNTEVKEGFYLENFDQKLVRVPNYFNIK